MDGGDVKTLTAVVPREPCQQAASVINRIPICLSRDADLDTLTTGVIFIISYLQHFGHQKSPKSMFFFVQITRGDS